MFCCFLWLKVLNLFHIWVWSKMSFVAPVTTPKSDVIVLQPFKVNKGEENILP